MKIQYLQESVFDTYKNKKSKEDKLKDLKKETIKISNKWFQENIVDKILEYYVPLMIDYDKRICTTERGINLLFDRATNKKEGKTQGLVVDISEIAGKIIIRQYVTSDECRGYDNLYFLKDETFTIFDDIEEYISEEFGPCEIILVNCEIEGAFFYNSDTELSKIKETPFLQYKGKSIKELIFGLHNIVSLDPIFKFLNRFESITPEIHMLYLNCDSLKSLENEIPLEFTKVEKIFLWGCTNLKSFNGWEKFMNNENPVVIYNINSILNNTGQDVYRYKIRPEFDKDPAVFELATKGKIQKRYIQYLGELKKKQHDNLNDMLRKGKEDVDYDVEGANIVFLEYNLKTEKVKQIYSS